MSTTNSKYTAKDWIKECESKGLEIDKMVELLVLMLRTQQAFNKELEAKTIDEP